MPVYFNSSLKSKATTLTRDMTAGGGDVSTTGIGFKPSSIIVLAMISAGTSFSVGFSDSSLQEYCFICDAAQVFYPLPNILL
jgi:hypothetical protein